MRTSLSLRLRAVPAVVALATVAGAPLTHPPGATEGSSPTAAQPAQRYAVVDAPSNLGLKPPVEGREPGVRRLPDVLRADSIVERLGAIDRGRVAAPPYAPARESDTGVRNAHALATYSVALADAIEASVKGGEIPVVLGGDCSVLLGATIALRRVGRYGVLFLDGHDDLSTPATSGTGGAAGMDLALALGHGPPLLANIEGRAPYVRESDAIVVGPRWKGARLQRDSATEHLISAMQYWLLDEARSEGIGNVVTRAIEQLRARGVGGIWIHLDADVLDDDIMPAVDSRQPGGMSFAEVREALVAALRTRLVVGIEVTILDPDLDVDGSIAKRFTREIAAALTSR